VKNVLSFRRFEFFSPYLGRKSSPAQPAALVFAVMLISSACSAQAEMGSGDVELMCSVKGREAVALNMTDAEICDLFKASIDQAMARPTKAVKAVSGIGQAEWLKLDVVFSKRGGVAANLVHKRASGEFVHPEVAVNIMDKPLGEDQVKRLASEVGKLVTNSAAR
jgi:hypothetical protein